MISSSRAGKKVPRRQGTRSKRRRLAAERRLALSTRQKWPGVSGRWSWGWGGGGALSGKLLLITTFCSRRSSLDHDWPGIRVRRSGGSPRSCFAWKFARLTFQFAVQAVPGTCTERFGCRRPRKLTRVGRVAEAIEPHRGARPPRRPKPPDARDCGARREALSKFSRRWNIRMLSAHRGIDVDNVKDLDPGTSHYPASWDTLSPGARVRLQRRAFNLFYLATRMGQCKF